MTPATMTRPAAPDRSLAQRRDALDRANRIRTQRARLKVDLRRGLGSIPGLLLEPPAYLETMKVFDLLIVIPRFGRVKVNKVLYRCSISPVKTVGGLSVRQRRELVAMLYGYGLPLPVGARER